MANYACIRTDNMSGTVEGKNLVSLQFNGAIENGTIVKVGALVSGQREVKAATLAAVGDPMKDLAIIASPEVVKDKTYHGLADFINENGSICRGYRLTQNDIFSVTAKAFAEDETPAVGNIVEVDGLGKMIAVASATSGSTTIGKIIAIEGEWYVIEVA